MKRLDSRGLSLLLVGLLTLLPLQRLSAQTGQTKQADKDKSFSLNIDGRLTFDAATYFVPGSSDLRYSGAPFRMSPASQVSQARIAAVVELDRWSGRFDLDFVRARVTLCDLFVRYSYAPQANITIGYIFDPISIGINTATRHRSVNLAPAVAPWHRARATGPSTGANGGVTTGSLQPWPLAASRASMPAPTTTARATASQHAPSGFLVPSPTASSI